MNKELLLSLLPILAFMACTQSPRDPLLKYLDDSLNGRYEEAYQYISSEDKKVKSLQDYLSEQSSEDNALANALREGLVEKTSFEIKELKTEGNRAIAKVDVTAPDFSGMFGEMFGAAFAAALGNEETQEKTAEQIADKYKSGDIPLKTTSEDFELLKEPDGWKVFLGWEFDSLLAEADRLKDGGKLKEALEKYDQALALKPESTDAKKGKEETQKEIEILEVKQAYMQKVELRDFRVGKGSRFSYGDPEPAVFGKIVNNGDRTLREVRITVYFLGEEGNAIAEKDYHPVLVTELSYGDNKPLKPGYIKDFGYVVGDSAPSVWSGRARAEVTNIEFKE